MTLGEYRVGISFNPSGNELVDKIKRAAADLIDLCNEQRAAHLIDLYNDAAEPAVKAHDAEIIRLWSLAMTHFEDAAMWAVKAATKKPM